MTILIGSFLGIFFTIVGFLFGFKRGYDKALKDNHVLSGKDAERFLEKMKELEG
jgi:hypothetical protein